MAGRSRSTFGKRQKEQKRQEKRLEKAARKDQRKQDPDKQSGPPIDFSGDHWGGVMNTIDPAEPSADAPSSTLRRSDRETPEALLSPQETTKH